MNSRASARELVEAFLDGLRHLDTSLDRCVELFADDGVFEFPYMPSIGMPDRFEGKAAIRRVLELIRSRFSWFELSGIEIHESKDEDGLFVRYRSTCFVDGTDKVYRQDYVTQLVAEHGRIKLLRETMNIIATARALLPNGLADVPEPVA